MDKNEKVDDGANDISKALSRFRKFGYTP